MHAGYRIGLDTLEFTNGICSGDATLEDVSGAATYSGEGVQTSYPVEMYALVYLEDTYTDCSQLPADSDSAIYYTPAVVPLYCNNEIDNGAWTMVLKSIGEDTELKWTSDDYIDSSTPMTKDPAVDSVNMDVEDAQFWTYSEYEWDQLLFYWSDSDEYLVTSH